MAVFWTIGRGRPLGLLFGMLAFWGVAAAAAADNAAAEAALARERLRVQSVGQDVAQLLAQANEARQAGNMADALNFYQAAERLDPANEVAIRGRQEMERRLSSSMTARTAVAGALERAAIINDSAAITADNLLGQAKTHFAQSMRPIAAADAGDVDRLPKALSDRQRELRFAASRLTDAEAQYRSLPPQANVAARLEECSRLRAEINAYDQDLQNRMTIATRDQARRVIQQTQGDLVGAQRKNIQLWRDKAEQAIKRKDWNQARDYLNAILSERDYDETARKRLIEVERLAIEDMAAKTAEAARNSRQQLLTKIDQVTADIPTPGKIFDFPDNWSEMMKVRESRNMNRNAKADEATAMVFAKLQKQASVGFTEAPMDDFCAWLGDQTLLSVAADPELRTNPKYKNLTITLRDVSNMRLETILNTVTANFDLSWKPWFGGILIQPRTSASDTLETLKSDVRDLLIRPRRVRKIHKFSIDELEEDDEDDEDDEEEELSEYTFNSNQFGQFLRTVMSYAFTPTAEGGNGGNVDMQRKMLTAKAQPSDIKILEKLLVDMRATKQISVSTMVRFLQMTDQFWEEFDSSFTSFDPAKTGIPFEEWDEDSRSQQFGASNTWNPTINGNTSRTWRMGSQMGPMDSYTGIYENLSPLTGTGMSMSVSGFGWLGKTNARWLLKAVKESRKADVLFAPHVVCYNNNTGLVEHLKVITEAYAVPSESGDGMTIRRDEYQDGISLQVRPLVSADHKYVTVYMAPQLLEVDPRGTSDLSMAYDGYTYNIPMRGMMLTQTKTYATIPNGGTVLLSGLSINIQMRSSSGVPVLKDIPILGHAFSRRGLQRDKQNFMTMVSSDIIILEDEEAKLNAPMASTAAF